MSRPNIPLDFVLNIGGKEEGDSILLTAPISDVQIRVDEKRNLYLHWNDENVPALSSVIDQYEGLKDGDVQLAKTLDVFGNMYWEPVKQPYLTEDEVTDIYKLIFSILGDSRVHGYQGSTLLESGHAVTIFKNRVYLDTVAVLNVDVKCNMEPKKKLLDIGFIQTRYGLPNVVPTETFCTIVTAARNMLETGTIVSTPTQSGCVTLLGHLSKDDFYISSFGIETKTFFSDNQQTPGITPYKYNLIKAMGDVIK